MATISAIDVSFKTVLPESGYFFDAESSVWLSKTRTSSLGYSDGEEQEERLLEIIQKSIDVRSGCSALASEIRDWTTEYHLSSVRTNLLRPLSHLLRGETLEIGAGTGALSRYIGELDGSLIAVEGSLRRAKIAAARCRSLDNVMVLCDDLESLLLDRRFDALVLVGVLEYNRLFGTETDPVVFLRKCRRFLKPGGCLILAIENKLGLKYLCGAPEDHVGIPYFGVEDRYSNTTAVTWGRRELLTHLRAAGLGHIQELYPFPDYKLPQLVLTQNSLSYGPVLRDLLTQYGPASDTGTTFQRCFSEAAAWKVLAENKLISDHANSFLLVASEDRLAELDGAYVYSSNRHRAFQCETRLSRTPGGLRVEKVPLYEDSRPETAKFKWSPTASPFRSGIVYSSLLEAILLRPGWNHDEVIAWARPYFELLLSRAVEDGLPGDQLDCGPHNLSLRADGKLEDFDLEWICLHDLPLGYVFFRSIIHCLTKQTAVAPGTSDAGLLNVVRAVMTAFALKADDEAIVGFLQIESELQSFVSGRAIKYTLDSLRSQKLRHRTASLAEVDSLKTALAAEMEEQRGLKDEVLRLQVRLADDEQKLRNVERDLHLERRIRRGLEESRCWRLTKPLRAAKAFVLPR